MTGRSSRLLGIVRHELRHHLRAPLFWLGGALLFVVAFLAVSVDTVAVDLGGAVGGVHRNAPYVIVRSLLQLSLLGVFVATAFVAGAVVRDYEHGMHETFFSLPIAKREYVIGRFTGALGASLLVFVFAVAAFALGGAMPWIAADRLGPFRVGPYLYTFLLVIFPNVLLFSAIVFATATATRSMMYSYAAVIAVVVAHAASRNFLGDLGTRGLASVLDPFGWSPFSNATRYWTTVERNGSLPGLPGPLLWNRALWLAVAVGILAASYARFSFTLPDRSGRRSRKERDRSSKKEHDRSPSLPPDEAAGRALATAWALPPVTLSFARATHVRQLLRVAGRETRRLSTSAPFLVILALGLLNFASNAQALEQFVGGMRPVPVTRLMVDIVTYFGLYAWIILAVYASELPWRERLAGMDELADALPSPLWVRWGGKVIALVAVTGILLLLAMAVAVLTQLSQGYTHLEPGLYLRGFFLVKGIPLVHFAVLALLVQVLVNHRFAGYLGLIGIALAYGLLSRLGLSHPLLWLPTADAELLGTVYSDMNGYGPFVRPVIWFYLYWSLATVLLLVGVHLLWPRGKEGGVRARLAIARRRWTPRVRTVAGVAGIGLVGVGSWIFYNTNVLNDYVPPERLMEARTRYEAEYGQYATLPQPTITAVRADVDIHPRRGALEIRGTYRLRNETSGPIAAVHVTTLPWLGRTEIEIAGATTTHRDSTLGYSIYALPRPLEPDEEMEMGFHVVTEREGFVARPLNLVGPFGGSIETNIVENGSFIRGGVYFPSVGYLRPFEVGSADERRRRGLPDREPLPPASDPDARRRMFAHADWIDFETVVSTSADQVALAPGDLVDEWEEDGRRFFHYRAEHPMEPVWVYLSGRWAVARDQWNDVEIAVYHHPDHAYNVQRMLDAAKASLELFSRAFGPYPETVLRIAEFPRYASFGESHATQVLISESAGFIADADDDDAEIDYVSTIVSHEVAHEWWGNSLIPALARGRMAVVESLAEYSALMATKHRSGEAAVRRYLRYSLDQYLQGRGATSTPERPLVDATDDERYVVYRKGGMALYALADEFGEAAVNGALRRFYADNAYGGAPFPTSLELLDYLEEVVPLDRRDVLLDWFETVTLWDLRAPAARATRRPDGSYVVRVDVEAGKYRVDEDGGEHDVPVDERVDIAVFGEPGRGGSPPGELLYLEKHRVASADTTLEIVVDGAPSSAGIDPFNKLLDRNPDDNVTDIEIDPDRSHPDSPPGASGGR